MFNKMKLMISLGMVVLSMAILFTGCGGTQADSNEAGTAGQLAGKVSVSGSTALLPLLKPAQEAFQEQHKEVTVNVAGGGSFTGMNQAAVGALFLSACVPPQPASRTAILSTTIPSEIIGFILLNIFLPPTVFSPKASPSFSFILAGSAPLIVASLLILCKNAPSRGSIC